MSERDVEGLRLVGFSGTKASGREAGVALYRQGVRKSTDITLVFLAYLHTIQSTI